MATVASTKVQPVYPTEPVFPLSVEQYHEMVRTGVLTHDDPVELIEGVLVFHMPKSPLHGFVLRAIEAALEAMFHRPAWHVRTQDPLTLGDGEPEPDVVLARGQNRDYLTRHPGPSDAPLVIEVSDSTLSRDRGMKRRSYARAGVQNYWIVDLDAQVLEVCADPGMAAPEPAYRSLKQYRNGDSVDVVIDGVVVGRISLREIFP